MTKRLLFLAALLIVGMADLKVGLYQRVQAQGVSGPRMSPVPDAQRTDEQKAIAAEFAASDMANAVGTLLTYPALARRIFTHDRYITAESTLTPRHRAILGLRTAWLARSNYLWAHRATLARRAGLTDADLRRIAQGTDAPGWDPFEAALLRTADELRVDAFISDASWKTLSAHFDVPQMIDTIDTVAETTMYAGVFNSLGVEIEPGFVDRLPAGVPVTVSAKRTNLRVYPTPRLAPAEAPPGGRGAGANVFRTFNRNPPADRVRGAINTHITGQYTLMPRWRELLLTRIGVLCRSEYEYAAHLRLGRQAGFTDADVARVINGPASAPGDPFETTLLQAADDLWENDVLSPLTWATLAKTLNPLQMLDVLISVGGYRSGSMLINSAGVQLDANMADFRFPPSMRSIP
jgi:alkylhydroperoxidase family enzyme